MMFTLTRHSLGLDLGSDAMKWVLVRSGLRAQVVETGTLPVKADHLAEHLSQLRGRLSVRPDVVVASVPSTRVYFQALPLPFRDRRKLQAVLPFELEQHLPRPAEGLVTDAVPHGGGCVALALDPKDFAVVRDQLAEAQLPARVMEPDLVAAARALLMTRESWSEAESWILLDVGHVKTGFAVLEQGQVVQMGCLHGGLAGLIEALAEREALSEEEVQRRLRERGLSAFAGSDLLLRVRYARLRLALRGRSRGRRRLVLCGGGALVPDLDKGLARELDAADAEVLDPEGVGPVLACAWGLAQRGLSRNVPCSVGLLSAEPESVPFWTRPRRRVAAVLGAAVLTLGALDLQQQVSRRQERLRNLEQQIERMFRSVAPETTRIVNAPHQLRSKMEEMERRLALFPDPSRDATHPLAVLSAVTAAVPTGVRLDVHSYTQSTDVLHLEGEIDSLGALSSLRTALEGLPFVQRVDVGAARKAVSERVGFQLDLALSRTDAGAAR
jgi:hypothetical protein